MRSTAIELEPLPGGRERDCSSRRSSRGASVAGRASALRALLERDGGQPALRRGDDPDARRERRRSRLGADPGHAAGADRRRGSTSCRPRRGRSCFSGRPSSAGCSGAGRSPSWIRRSTSTRALDDLLERELLPREPLSSISGETAYRFKHVLIREVAYSGLAKGERAQLHRDVRRVAPLSGRGTSSSRSRLPPRSGRRAPRRARGAVPADLRAEAADVLERARLPRARARGEPHRTPAAAPLDRARAQPGARFHAARAAWRLRELPAASVEMEKVRDPRAGGRRAHDRGPRAHRAGGDRPEPERRRADRRPARRRGARPARRRARRRTVRGAHAPEQHRLVGGRPRRGRALRGRDRRDRARGGARRSREPRRSGARGGRPSPGSSSTRAEELLEAGSALAEASGSISGRAWACRIRGSILLRRGRFDEAAERVSRRVRAVRRDRGGAGRRSDTAARRAWPSGGGRGRRARGEAGPRGRADAPLGPGAGEDRRGAADAGGDRPRPGPRRRGGALGALGGRDRRDAGHDVALERPHGARARPRGAGSRRGGRSSSSARRSPCSPRPTSATASSSRSTALARFLRERGRDDEAARYAGATRRARRRRRRAPSGSPDSTPRRATPR